MNENSMLRKNEKEANESSSLITASTVEQIRILSDKLNDVVNG